MEGGEEVEGWLGVEGWLRGRAVVKVLMGSKGV